jgi:methionyl-tRNA formyltransferase
MNIIYIGTSEFAVKPLKLLLEQGFNVCAVVTRKDKAGGRGKKIIKSPVKEFAEKRSLNILQPDNINCNEIKNFIQKNNINLGIVVSYGGIIKEFIYSLPEYGMINIHPSLLPKYRGPSPIQSALLNGDKETGVSVIRITDKMDAGPVLLRERIDISTDDNFFTLHDMLAETGACLLIKCVKQIKAKKISEHPQNEHEAVYCNIIDKESGLIRWNEPAEKIHNKIRAFVKWPVAFTYLNGKVLKIYASKYNANYKVSDKISGTVVKLSKKSFGVVCGDGVLLEILKLQLQGKKVLQVNDFLNGIKLTTGDLLG